jgi:hypothetical protein
VLNTRTFIVTFDFLGLFNLVETEKYPPVQGFFKEPVEKISDHFPGEPEKPENDF